MYSTATSPGTPPATPPVTSSPMPTDGRRARRERSRNAVVDAAFELIRDGKAPPTVDQIAERAGVSVSSIFRMFDGLDDVQRRALDRFQERYSSLFGIELDDGPDRPERIRRYVRARVTLHTEAGPIMRVARQRALEHEAIAEQVSRSRERLVDQTRRCFQPELSRCTTADAASLTAAVDALTSPEAFDLASAAHSRTPRQITATWTRALTAVVDEWCGAPSSTEARSGTEETRP